MNKKLLLGLLGVSLLISSCLKNQYDESQKQEKIDRKTYLSDLHALIKSANRDKATYPRLDTTFYWVKDPIYKQDSFCYIRLDSGILSKTDIKYPSDSDYIYVNVTGSLINGTVFETSDHNIASANGLLPSDVLKGPHILRIDSLAFLGLRECLPLLRLGATYKFIIPSGLALGIYATNMIPSYSTLIYDVQLVKIGGSNKAYKTIDDNLVNQWVKSLKLLPVIGDIETDIIYSKVDSVSSADSLVDGNTVKVLYKGKILEGNRYFTDSTKYDSITFVLGQNQVIKGWELALHHLKDSCQAEIVIPYNMGYTYGLFNSYGQVVIPEYRSLYFELNKIIRVKK